MAEHILKAYDEDLRELRALIGEMGLIVDQQVRSAHQSLWALDSGLAQHVVQKDHAVDTLHQQVEEKAILIIARRQPVASDLREIIASIRIVSNLERIGDCAKNTAKRCLAMADRPNRFMAAITPVGELAEAELRDVLAAFSDRNSPAALAVWDRDEQLDDLYNAAFRQLLTHMLENPRNISTCTHLLFAAKNMERIGDHATNIAENICYMVEGRVPAGARPKTDGTILSAI